MSAITTLLAAVRRRLWRTQVLAAARLACWISTALMLAAMAWHLAIRPLPVEAVAIAVAACWAASMAWAGWRRPADWDCALWADRHLGGASAFTTWLDLGRGRLRSADAQAVAWLEQWAGSRVPHALQVLARRREAARWSPPVLSMLASAALAVLVLSIPDLGSSTRVLSATPSPAGAGGLPMADAGDPRQAELSTKVDKALRSIRTRETPSGPSEGGASTAAGRTGEPRQPASSLSPPTNAGELATAGSVPSATAAQATATGRPSPAGAGASGREAGDSRDDSSDAGNSRLPQSTIAVQRREIGPLRPRAEWQANMERLVTYDEELATDGNTGPAVGAPAATPPSATASTRLSPSEASYVQSWTRASAPRR